MCMKKLSFLLILIIITTLLYSETLTHIVKGGDTLYGLALKYKTTTNKILTENNLNSNSLKIDQVIKVTRLEQDKYIVESGDTLSGIAFEKDITLKHLLLVNRISSDYNLTIGEELTIPTDSSIKQEYTVQKGDTLSWISMTYDVAIEDIVKINNLDGNNLILGNVLKLTSDSNNQPEIKRAAVNLNLPGTTLKQEIDNNKMYTVKAGNTISGIAYSYQTSTEDLKKLNGLENNNIKIGQKLKLPDYAVERAPINYNIYHQVVKGDTLSGIAQDYDISETVLRELNNLKGDNISIGQNIKLIPRESREHLVNKGETLWSIARLYNISVDQLMQYNHLNSTQVTAGKTLTLYDYSVISHNTITTQENYSLVALKYNHNTTASQPYKDYAVDQLINPLNKYNTAKDKWKEFSNLIENESLISNDLAGWTVVLDPGHGGKDPGAIATVNLNGIKKYIVEDEYAYDTAVRLYELLKRNGAEVHMTILSPDHIARNPDSNYTTFINEKNEVYNNYALNRLNNSTIWPVGGQWGLNQRVSITNNLLSTSENKNTIFISLHADNDVDRGVGKLVLFKETSSGSDLESKEFAKSLIEELGPDATIDSMSLAVLRNNNADVKVLIELRNMAHLSEALALLDSKKRQNDALMILNGIKNYIKH